MAVDSGWECGYFKARVNKIKRSGSMAKSWQISAYLKSSFHSTVFNTYRNKTTTVEYKTKLQFGSVFGGCGERAPGVVVSARASRKSNVGGRWGLNESTHRLSTHRNGPATSWSISLMAAGWAQLIRCSGSLWVFWTESFACSLSGWAWGRAR